MRINAIVLIIIELSCFIYSATGKRSFATKERKAGSIKQIATNFTIAYSLLGFCRVPCSFYK